MIISNQVTGQSIRFLQTAKDSSEKLLEMESTFQAHSAEPISHYRLAKPPYVILKFAFILLVPIAFLFGYRGTYKKYLD